MSSIYNDSPPTGEVHAVATMAGRSKWSGRDLVKKIEQAMSDAVLKACEEGLSISNPDHAPEIRARMMAARQEILDVANTPETPES